MLFNARLAVPVICRLGGLTLSLLHVELHKSVDAGKKRRNRCKKLPTAVRDGYV